MDFLKRDIAPLTDNAWQLLTREATRSLRASLTARRLVKVNGPLGLAHGAVSLGRLDIPEQQPLAGVRYGLHRVQPLVEMRAPFELDIWELDNADRGAADVDFDPLLAAVKCITAVEEGAVYQGFASAGITGMAKSARHAPVTLGADASAYADALTRALITLREADVHGPFALVLGPQPYRILEGTSGAYPPRKQVEQLVGGPVLLSPHIAGGFLVATGTDDLELTLGEDYALGYETHTPQKVRLFLTLSFTFRVLNAVGYVPLTFTG